MWALVMWKVFLSIYKLIWSTVALFKQCHFQQVPQDWSSSQSDEEDSGTSRETVLTVLLLIFVSVQQFCYQNSCSLNIMHFFDFATIVAYAALRVNSYTS